MKSGYWPDDITFLSLLSNPTFTTHSLPYMGRVSVQRGLCLEGRVSVQGVSVLGMSLSRGISVQDISVRGSLSRGESLSSGFSVRDTPYEQNDRHE